MAWDDEEEAAPTPLLMRYLKQRRRCLIIVFMFWMNCCCCLTAAVAEEEEKRHIYLVLMEEQPVAFHRPTTTTPLGHQQVSGGVSTVNPQSETLIAHAKHLVTTHDNLLQTTLESKTYNKLYSFNHILNGFAVHTTPSQAHKIKQAHGVKLIEKDRGVKLMTTYTPQFLGLPQGVWTQEGGEREAGEGIVIGFIDTGINPNHPSFAYDPLNPYKASDHFSGACEKGPRFHASSCNGKIVSARYFAAGARAMATLNSSVDFLSPFDTVGHGSHVASTAAGNYGVPVVVDGFFYGRASGMAPRARIAVYKAVYSTVGTLADVVSAIDQAVLDGVDILTLSIGPEEPPEDTLTFLSVFDICMLFARRAGVFVVQAAGNGGPGPYSIVSYSPWSVGVASCSTDRSYPGTLVLGNGQKFGGVGLSGPTFGSEMFQYKLVLSKDAMKVNGSFPGTPQYVEECQYPEAFDPVVVQGNIVICTFSGGFYNQTSTVTAIIETAKLLGFMGFILLANPAYGDFVAEPVPFAVPGILIPKIADSQAIMQYYEEKTSRDTRRFMTRFGARASIGEGRVASFGMRAPTVSRFSSRGPDFIDVNRTPADVLKPDIMAPGHQIWGAWSPMSVLEPILAGQNFALISGTSMATPHVAGIAALVKQLNPSWTPSMIASAISTTATKYDNLGDPLMAESFEIDGLHPAAPFGFGAGLINPTHALDPGLVFLSGYEDFISFLCSLPNTNPDIIKAATGGFCDQLLSYPGDLNLPSVTITSLKGSRVVRRSVKNIGNKTETYVCSVLPPNGTAVNLYPPWFTIGPQQTQDLDIHFNVSQATDAFSFGEIVLTGSLDHIVRIPLSVLPISAS